MFVVDDDHMIKLVLNQLRSRVEAKREYVTSVLNNVTGINFHVIDVISNNYHEAYTNLIVYGVDPLSGSLLSSGRLVYLLSSQLIGLQDKMGDIQIVEMIKPYDNRSLGSVEVFQSFFSKPSLLLVKYDLFK